MGKFRVSWYCTILLLTLFSLAVLQDTFEGALEVAVPLPAVSRKRSANYEPLQLQQPKRSQLGLSEALLQMQQMKETRLERVELANKERRQKKDDEEAKFKMAELEVRRLEAQNQQILLQIRLEEMKKK